MSVSVEDQRALRNAFGAFPTGVCIVTCSVDEEKLGMTMSSFNSLSLDPPLVLFSIDKRANGLPLWQRAEGYAIHVLSQEQTELSNRFARPGNKWEGVKSQPGAFDVPLLSGAAAVFTCAADRVIDGGDHLLFIARVTEHRTDADRNPLVFAKGRYASLKLGEQMETDWPLAIHY
ncbi:flavin reductase family protein [Rhodobacteraceae bacterium D3-12]|nr:flavin reductase family protein [Rhodobacteraceae bacterium D3-12]